MPNPPAEMSHQPALMPAGAADPRRRAPRGPAHPPSATAGIPSHNKSTQVTHVAGSQAQPRQVRSSPLVFRFKVQSLHPPSRAGQGSGSAYPPNPPRSGQHRLQDKAAPTGITTAKSLPFSLPWFAFQDKNKKKKQLPTCLGDFKLLESNAQAIDDFMYGILCQGR